MPECAFEIRMHAPLFGGERALELLGLRMGVPSYLVAIVQQFSRVLPQSTPPPAVAHSFQTTWHLFNFIHSDGVCHGTPLQFSFLPPGAWE